MTAELFERFTKLLQKHANVSSFDEANEPSMIQLGNFSRSDQWKCNFLRSKKLIQEDVTL
jgi:hypothetical protein